MRFSEKIMLKQQAKAKYQVNLNSFRLALCQPDERREIRRIALLASSQQCCSPNLNFHLFRGDLTQSLRAQGRW
jgi:hypothetical protein